MKRGGQALPALHNENCWANGLREQNIVDQQRGTLGHPPGTTAGTNSACYLYDLQIFPPKGGNHLHALELTNGLLTWTTASALLTTLLLREQKILAVAKQN